MNAEIDRLKQDLETIEEAVGAGPEFDRRHVWTAIGWGISGLILTLLGVFPYAIPLWPWGKMIFLVLGVGLPFILCRLFVPELPSLYWFSPTASAASQDLNSFSLAGIIGVFLIGFCLWLGKLSASPEVVRGAVSVLGGSWFVVWAWRKPWRHWMMTFGLALVAGGFVIPFLPHKAVIPALGIALALGSFTGAIILHRQLKNFHANGKAAH